MSGQKLRTAKSRLIRRKLGDNIRTLRERRGLSQVELAGIAQMHQAALCRIEHGLQALPPEKLYFMARYFGVTIDELFALARGLI